MYICLYVYIYIYNGLSHFVFFCYEHNEKHSCLMITNANKITNEIIL